MIVSAVIVEQLDIDGHLRTFRMKSDHSDQLTIAFAGEYDEPRTGPFHFLEDKHEKNFEAGFAECSARKLTPDHYRSIDNGYEFKTFWRGIPTQRQETSYYALSLPANTIPTQVRFCDPRSNRDFRKGVGRDLQRNCFVLYLECRSSYGSFDFDLHTQFSTPTEKFLLAEYSDENTTEYYAQPPAYEHQLRNEERCRVQNFFLPREHVGDVFITHQAGAVGPNARAQEISLEQRETLISKQIDLRALAQELDALYQVAKRQEDWQGKQEELASLADAAKAASAGDGIGVVEHLRKAGRWTFDLANGVGSSVAATAISKAIGL